MSPLRRRSGPVGDQRGYTMIELLIAMSLGTVISLAALAFLQFGTSDVSHITARVRVDQSGRTVLEKIALKLHSTCVTPSITPIKAGSNENLLKFVSEGGKESAFATVHLHEIIYTPASGKTEGTLTEKTVASTPPPTGKAAPEYTFPSTRTTTTLLKGVKQSEKMPVFQYYRYYQPGDTTPEGSKVLPYGELNPAALSATYLEKEENAENVVKVTINFTLAPEGNESASFNHDRPVPLEDSVVLRLAPSSESSSNPNSPCSPET